MKKGHVIWIEGIIGAGKSTLTKAVAERFNYRPIFEPVEANFVLEPFYKDPSRFAFPMQMHLLMVRYNLQLAAATEAIGHISYSGAVLDRGLPGDRVFAKLMTQDGFMDPIEWRIYENAYDIMSASLRPPSLLVYLDVDPVEARRRVETRARACEDTLPLEYLQKLQVGYEELLEEIQSNKHPWSRGISVLRIPWSQPHLPLEPALRTIEAAL